ncbi:MULTISPECIES: hypothetical protein [unclassified Mesorhizobium]|uniref:hypothetical protein n=1 Tax=unclassified Mesorhizobium TaxID=325217 RepID=UPI001126FBCC|nr:MULTISPECIES: hypothetical protein [unclassified Mesorhizobium]TPJ70476.1 hypothetical protein FJ462_07210 [Mesorhizobium sp. B2-6-7]TPJ76867.1 hypothetical protein FJ422_29610 [Mesorhizobium sp. B2-6-3]
MTRDFLPEYSQMPRGSRYLALYRLFAGSGWKYVRKDGAPVECDTASQAIEAAKECVKRILNPEIRSEQAAVVEDVLGVEAWQRARAGQAAEIQESALGAIIIRGRQVKVERKRA